MKSSGHRGISALEGSEAGRTAVVVGCGESLSRTSLPRRPWKDGIIISCNRAIEVVESDYWIWVDRFHFERSKWHENAIRAVAVGWIGHVENYPSSIFVFQANREVPPCRDGLFLSRGTGTAAASLAVLLGASRIVFVGWDGWTPNRDRYHSWSGTPMSRKYIRIHKEHLRVTRAGIQRLRRQYPDVSFVDATRANRYLGLEEVSMDDLVLPEDRKKPSGFQPDSGLPIGYGRLVAVTSPTAEDAILWFEDATGTVRAIRVSVEAESGLTLAVKGQAVISRS